MKNTERAPRHIYLSKEIYEAFARSVKAQGKQICDVLEEFMSAYSGTYEVPGVTEKMIFLKPPARPSEKALSEEEKTQVGESLKNTLMQHVDIVKCSHCGEIRPIDAQTKQYFERQGLTPRCKACEQEAEVVERCRS